MKNQNDLFIVEHENGEWIDSTGDGGWSCWTTRAEAQDALDSEADNDKDQTAAYKVVRFMREPLPIVLGLCAFNQTGHLGPHTKTLYCENWNQD
jgi:hypothetical protein